MPTVVRLNERIRIKSDKYKGVDKGVTGKITQARGQGKDQPVRVRIFTDEKLKLGARSKHVVWVDFADVELLEPCIENLPHIDGMKDTLEDKDIFFEAELFMKDEELRP